LNYNIKSLIALLVPAIDPLAPNIDRLLPNSDLIDITS